MKKETTINYDPNSVHLPAIRVEVFLDPLSLHCNPQNTRRELECALETSRQMVTTLGEHRETIIIYTDDTRMLLFPCVRNDRDMMTAGDMIEHFVEKYGGRAVTVAYDRSFRELRIQSCNGSEFRGKPLFLLCL